MFLSRIFICLFLGMIVSCQSHSPKPLEPQRTFEQMKKSRHHLQSLPSHQQQSQQQQWQFTFTTATRLLAENSPVLQKKRSQYKKAYQLAKLKTPLPNPELEAGVLIGSRLGNNDGGQAQPLVAFGFTIPLGYRLSHQDEVNTALAKYHYLQYVAEHRTEYLKFRRFYIKLLLLHQEKEIHNKIVQSVEKSLKVVEKLIEAGFATALDIGIMQLELLQKQDELAKVEGKLTKVRGQLAQLLGVSQKLLLFAEKPPIPSELTQQLPPLEQLKETMLTNNSQLALLRATYKIVEKELQLEISKQAPDITLSPSFEGDPGADKNIWGISVSLPVPVFDQNERGITDKQGKREVIRTEYQGALSKGLAQLETSYQRYQQQQERFSRLQNTILKKAEQNVAIAFKTLKRAEVDFLKYLDSERSLRKVLLETHAAKLAMYQAWFDIEQIIGTPLWLLPEEKSGNVPSFSTISDASHLPPPSSEK